MTEWTRHAGGAGWYVLDDGRIKLEPDTHLGGIAAYVCTDADGCIRTKGAPLTMQTLRGEYGATIAAVASAFDLPEHWIAGMVSIEARKLQGSYSFDVVSLRHEPGYFSPEETPNKVSAGLMQTLLSTAKRMAREYFDGVAGTGEFLLPQSEDLTVEDLTDPEVSLALGAAYMHFQSEIYGLDPVLLVASYNAGGVYETSKNPWRLRTFGYPRIPKFCGFANDYLETV